MEIYWAAKNSDFLKIQVEKNSGGCFLNIFVQYQAQRYQPLTSSEALYYRFTKTEDCSLF